jgi:hypothetical protein
MFRGFVAGVFATIVVALVGGYIVLRSGLTTPMPSPVGRKPGRRIPRCKRRWLARRPRVPIRSRCWRRI